jgi:hypothetical protein
MSETSNDSAVPDIFHLSPPEYIAAQEPAALAVATPPGRPAPEPCAAYWLGRCLDAKTGGAAKILVEDWPLLPPSSRALGGAIAPTSSATFNLLFNRPDQIQLSLFETGAGVVPLVEVGARSDFLLLISRLTRRGSVPVGDSMGSCFVGGIINRRRRAPFDLLAAEGLVPTSTLPSLCHDRAILIWTGGGYAGLDGAELGLPEVEWLAKSALWRRVHEGCHHVVRRNFPGHSFGLRDEIIADFDGLWQSCGSPDLHTLSLALGLEESASSAGRIAGYIAPSGARLVVPLVTLVRSAVANLTSLYSTWCLADWQRLRLREIVALSSLDLIALASSELAMKLDQARHALAPCSDE